MKIPKIILSVLLIAVLIAVTLCVTGCSDSGVAGTYTLIDASGDGNEMFKATVGDVTLEIGSDSKGTLSMMDQQTPVEINEKQKKISFDGGETFTSYTMEGKKLTVENNGNKVVFKKK